MVKKALLTSVLVILFSGVLAMVYFIVEKVAKKKAVAEKIQSLSAEDLFTLDSVQFRFPNSKPSVLIYFNSGCEHCQYELGEIKKNIKAFENAHVLWMSSENISEIKKVADGFGSSNVIFLKINREDVFEKFGALSVPHLLIYSADQKLVKEFKGETKIEAILQHLPK